MEKKRGENKAFYTVPMGTLLIFIFCLGGVLLRLSLSVSRPQKSLCISLFIAAQNLDDQVTAVWLFLGCISPILAI